MEAYRTETTLTEDGTVTVAPLPFKAGQRVEVIILPASPSRTGRGHERLRGMVARYDDPLEPAVPPEEWKRSDDSP
jgi:hypothetical protein